MKESIFLPAFIFALTLLQIILISWGTKVRDVKISTLYIASLYFLLGFLAHYLLVAIR